MWYFSVTSMIRAQIWKILKKLPFAIKQNYDLILDVNS